MHERCVNEREIISEEKERKLHFRFHISTCWVDLVASTACMWPRVIAAPIFFIQTDIQQQKIQPFRLSLFFVFSVVFLLLLLLRHVCVIRMQSLAVSNSFPTKFQLLVIEQGRASSNFCFGIAYVDELTVLTVFQLPWLVKLNIYPKRTAKATKKKHVLHFLWLWETGAPF